MIDHAIALRELAAGHEAGMIGGWARMRDAADEIEALRRVIRECCPDETAVRQRLTFAQAEAIYSNSDE